MTGRAGSDGLGGMAKICGETIHPVDGSKDQLTCTKGGHRFKLKLPDDPLNDHRTLMDDLKTGVTYEVADTCPVPVKD